MKLCFKTALLGVDMEREKFKYYYVIYISENSGKSGSDKMIDEVKKNLIHDIVKLARFWRFSEGCGLVYASLILSENPLTMKDIEKETGYSKSSVSSHLDTLLRHHLVNKKKVGKKNFFYPERDFPKIYREVIRESLRRDIKPLKEKIEYYKEKMKNLEETSFLEHLEKISEKLGNTELFLEKFLVKDIGR